MVKFEFSIYAYNTAKVTAEQRTTTTTEIAEISSASATVIQNKFGPCWPRPREVSHRCYPYKVVAKETQTSLPLSNERKRFSQQDEASPVHF